MKVLHRGSRVVFFFSFFFAGERKNKKMPRRYSTGKRGRFAAVFVPGPPRGNITTPEEGLAARC